MTILADINVWMYMAIWNYPCQNLSLSIIGGVSVFSMRVLRVLFILSLSVCIPLRPRNVKGLAFEYSIIAYIGNDKIQQVTFELFWMECASQWTAFFLKPVNLMSPTVDKHVWLGLMTIDQYLTLTSCCFFLL